MCSHPPSFLLFLDNTLDEWDLRFQLVEPVDDLQRILGFVLVRLQKVVRQLSVEHEQLHELLGECIFEFERHRVAHILPTPSRSG